MSHESFYHEDGTLRVSLRLTRSEMELIEIVKQSRPHIRTLTEAVRVIFKMAEGVPEPVYIVAGLAPLDDVRQFHKDVSKFVMSVKKLASCIAGDMTPEAYADEKMQEHIRDLRQQAEALPDELRRLTGVAARIQHLLGAGLTHEEERALRRLQAHFAIEVKRKEAVIANSSDAMKAGVEELYRCHELLLTILDRLFGPAPETKG